MVLESIFNPFVFKKRPWETFLVGFVYSIVTYPYRIWFLGRWRDCLRSFSGDRSIADDVYYHQK